MCSNMQICNKMWFYDLHCLGLRHNSSLGENGFKQSKLQKPTLYLQTVYMFHGAELESQSGYASRWNMIQPKVRCPSSECMSVEECISTRNWKWTQLKKMYRYMQKVHVYTGIYPCLCMNWCIHILLLNSNYDVIIYRFALTVMQKTHHGRL